MSYKYQHILDDLLIAIDSGQFHRGQKLPSLRQLSQQYHCSKDTVQKALIELKHQHKIYAVEKSGYYVLEQPQHQVTESLLSPQDVQAEPYEDFRLCLNESLIGHTDYLFNYYHQQEGLEQLLHSLHHLLTDYHIYAKKNQLVITAGSQQALYILSQLDFPNQGTHILLEEPTYHRMRELVEQQQLPFQTIPRTLTGIDLESLEKLFRSGTISCFYTIPRLHNPLGTSYSLKEKTAIVELATTYNVYIIEDDYLADFDPNRQVPLHYLDTNEHTIYIKSFSTTLFPALRIAGVVLPSRLVEPFLKKKNLMDYDTNLIMQKALSLYIDNGMFQRNTRQLRETALQIAAQIHSLSYSYNWKFPIHTSQQGLLVQVPTTALTPTLKHSALPLIWHSNHAYWFALLPFEDSFEENLLTLYKLLQDLGS